MDALDRPQQIFVAVLVGLLVAVVLLAIGAEDGRILTGESRSWSDVVSSDDRGADLLLVRGTLRHGSRTLVGPGRPPSTWNSVASSDDREPSVLIETVALRDAALGDRERLGALLADYLFEFDGQTAPYPYLDAYWRDKSRLPMLIEVNGQIVGLCLIRLHKAVWSIAEFCVVAALRRQGVGRRAVDALSLRAKASGATYLEAAVLSGHPEALRFWLAVGFEEIEVADGETVGRHLSRRLA
jgi:predicted acetyltransferase